MIHRGSEIDFMEEARPTPVHDAMISVSCFRTGNYIFDEVEGCILRCIMEVVCVVPSGNKLLCSSQC